MSKMFTDFHAIIVGGNICKLIKLRIENKNINSQLKNHKFDLKKEKKGKFNLCYQQW